MGKGSSPSRFPPQNTAPAGFTYDAAGNVTSDGTNSYLYDAEGRLCAMQGTSPTGGTISVVYVYDAEGRRVAKESVTTTGSLTCDPAQSGATVTETYLLGQSGEEVTTLDSSGSWQQTNVYANGLLFAIYDQPGLHFHLTDPLGTRRVQTNYQGWPELQCQSLPFGDQLTCAIPQGAAPTADDATAIHFTGKQRDQESGNDYFGARYYASAVGRWVSPDPSGEYFADPGNPQTWNMYAYVANEPLINIDPGGLWIWNEGSCYYDTVATYVDGEFQGYDTQPLGCFSYPPDTTQLSPVPSRNPSPVQLPQTPQIDCSKPPPLPPATPPGADVNANESATKNHGTGWWLSKVRPGGAWDYKQGGQQYAAFGNVNFGATCDSLGDNLAFCQRGAGAAAYGTAALNVAEGGKWTAGPGNPAGSPASDNGMPDYGDQATGTENQAVIAGFGYAQWQKACGK